MFAYTYKCVGSDEWHVCYYPGDLEKIREDIKASLASDARTGDRYEYRIVQLTPIEKPVVHNIIFEPTNSF